jgi:hypothetical protein
VRTVHKHVEHTYRKLDLPNRTTLTALIHRGAAQPGGAQEGRMRASERSEVSGR